MPSSASIEDLFKKATPSGNSPSSMGQGKKPSPTKPISSTTQQLADKMREIQLSDLEKRVQVHAQQLGMPYISLKEFPISPEALGFVPKKTAAAIRVLGFLQVGNELRLATDTPSEQVSALVETIGKEHHVHTELYLVSAESFATAFKLYDILPEPKEFIAGYRIEETDLAKYEQEIADMRQLQAKIGSVSITDVITLMIGAALRASASDIHVEAEETDVKIRFRIDGILREAASLPKTAWKQTIARLKLLAQVKINIESVPQDGRITIYLGSEKIDIRVSFLPTAFGESVVMRILRQKTIALEFENLGVRGLALERLTREIAKPNGMIITTGPTGSGKTTTLYAILKKLNTAAAKIITLEDPIEYKLVGVNQSQIDHAKGYDFAKGLRSILRQDPDIVMVGEIRDLETADIAIQASLTGHLVVSTIHTNSAAGAIPRFLSMGVKPFLLAPALNAVIGQRLVRKLCQTCRIEATLSKEQQTDVMAILKTIPATSGHTIDLEHLHFFAAGKGCDACSGMGYKGRVGIYEIFTMSKEIEQVILSKEVSEYMIQELAVKDGMLTMAQDGLLKALDGLTSVDEVLAVANTNVIETA